MNIRATAGSTTLLVALAASLTACGGGQSGTGAVQANCKPAHTFSTLQKGTLTVATFVSPPYTQLAREGSDVGGVDGDIIQRLAKTECLTIDAKPVAGAALIGSMTSKKADLAIGGIYRTADRAKILSLSDTMYRDGMALLSKSGVSSLSDLQGKKVGVVQGYLWNQDLQNALGPDHVTVYQDSDSMISDLQAGRVDVAVLTSAEGAYRAKQLGGNVKAKQMQPTPKVAASTAPGQVVLAVQQDEKELTDAFNADLQKLIQDGSVASILKNNGMDPSLAGSGS